MASGCKPFKACFLSVAVLLCPPLKSPLKSAVADCVGVSCHRVGGYVFGVVLPCVAVVVGVVARWRWRGGIFSSGGGGGVTPTLRC